MLGILGGTAVIPEKWSAPIGEKIVLHELTGDFNDAPATISELTERTMVLAEKSLEAKQDISFGDATRLPEDLRTRLFRNDLAREALKQDIHAGVELLNGQEIWLHYHGEPVLRPGIGKELEVSISGCPTPDVDLLVPDGWQCLRLGPSRFQVLACNAVSSRNTISVVISGEAVEFVILGPDEAKGYEAGIMVPAGQRWLAREAKRVWAQWDDK